MNMNINVLVLSTLLMAAGVSASCSQNRSESGVNESTQQRAAFPTFEGSLTAPIGNHGTMSMELISQNHFKTTNQYDSDKHERVLNLADGTMELTGFNLSGGTSKKEVLTAQDAAYLVYHNALSGMIDNVQWIKERAHFNQESDTQLVDAVLSSLVERLAQADAKAPESLSLSVESYKGPSLWIRAQYLAREPGDMLFEILDSEGATLSSKKVSVAAGIQYVSQNLTVESAPANNSGSVKVTLLKPEGQADAVRAEATTSVEFK